MDPLSITASIITNVAAAAGTVKTGKSLYDAPGELESLLNDLADSQVLLQSVKESIQESQSCPNSRPLQSQKLSEKLTKAEAIVMELVRMINEDLTSAKASDRSKVKRTAWMRAKARIGKLKSKLQNIHGSLEVDLGRFER